MTTSPLHLRSFSAFPRFLKSLSQSGLLLVTALLVWPAHAITLPPTATVPTHALRFGGVNQYVSVPHTAALNVTTQFTIEAWINITAFDKNDMAFVSKGDDLVIMRNGNTPKLAFRTKSSAGTDDLLSTANLVTGRWYYVAAVCNGATKSLYVDGVLDVSKVYTNPVNLNTSPLYFGANSSPSKNLTGQLDTVRFWSVARSLTQIRADLDRNLYGDEPGLLGEWRFDEPAGTVAKDSSTASRDGTLSNIVAADRVLGLAFRPPPPRSTVPGGAVSFNTDDRQFIAVDSRFEPDFDPTGNTLTVEAWVNVTAFDQPWQAIVTKGESWGLTRSNNTSKVVFRTKNGAVIHDLGSTDDLLPGRWYHIAGVCDGTQKRLYIDGVPDTSAAYTASLVANNFPVVIGANAESPNRDFNGTIEDVRVWSIARSAADLDANKLRNLRGGENGLLGDWRLDEGQRIGSEGVGSVAIDSSYGERHATLVNMTDDRNRVAGLAFTQAPPASSVGTTEAVRLTGDSGAAQPRVVIPSEDQFDVTESLTIEAWIYVEAFDKPWQAIVTKGDAWGLTRYQETSRLDFRTQRGLKFHDLAGNTPLDLNRWYHVAAVFDGSQKRLYLDGVLDASAPLPEAIEVNDLPVVIGANAAQANRAFRGRIDSVRLWSSARTAEEIAAQFDRDMRGSEAGLLGDWRFNEASGTTALDSSKRHLDGTLTDLSLPGDRVGGLLLRDAADGDLAVAFDQSGAIKQFIQLPDEAKFDFPSQFSVETWVYFDELPSATVALVSKGSSAWELLLRPSGKIQFTTAGANDPGSIPPSDLVSASALPTKSWQHLAAAWNPLTGAKSIYLNGVLDQAHTGITGTLAQNNLPVLFGAQSLPGGQGSYFAGTLDEVRLWSSERSGDRIRDNHGRRLTGIEPQLAGVWSMNEGSGNTVLDRRTGSPSNGAFSAGMTSLNRVDGQPLDQPAAAQYAVTLNGTSQYIEIADNAALTLTGKATFEAWVRPTGTGWRTILSKGNAGYGLAIDDQNRLRFHISATRDQALMSDSRLENGVWQHVAVVVNNAPAGTTFYINGQPAGQSSAAILANQPGSLWIGRRSATAPTDYFAGQIDEVRIWNTARSPQEVEFFAFRAPSPQTAGLTAYWAFNEGRGLAVAELTANRLNGVFQNMDDSNWQDGQLWPVASVDANVNLQADTSSKGLWIGNITLTSVNEVQKAINGASPTTTPTADTASIRVLLHVDAAGRVRMLKDVVVMQTYTDPKDTSSVKRVVLVTDPGRIPQFQGIVQRGGKLVGIRHGSVAYDFAGNELVLVGGLGKGVGCAGTINLDPDAATNPFRHRYHPDHRSGYAIGRQFSFQFNGAPGDPLTEGPNYGVQRLTGVYKETLTGLHKIALRIEGVVTLDRISPVDVLNDGKF